MNDRSADRESRQEDTFRPLVTAVPTALTLLIVASVVVGFVVGPTLSPAGVATGQQDTGDANGTYAVQQGEQCFTVTPLNGSETVREFYDYRIPYPDNPYITTTGSGYSSEGTDDLQQPNTSSLFLYREDGGNLSLVFLHGTDNESSAGGSLTAEIAGLPEDGEWAVRDDDYNGSDNYDNWTVNRTGGQIDWTWNGGKTDGGAYEGLGDEFTITVDPSFNEEAELYGVFYNGTVGDWTTISGERADPDRRALNLSEPVRISTRSCDALTAEREEGSDGSDTDDGTGADADGEDGTVEQEQSVTVQQEQEGADGESQQDVVIERKQSDGDDEDDDDSDREETGAGDDEDEDGDSRNDAAPGNSGEAPGRSGDALERSEQVPGNGVDGPGNSGNPPGHGGGPPGHGGGPPGHSAGPPGHSAGPPGHSAGPPGHGGGPGW